MSNFWKRALSGGAFVSAVTGAIYASPWCFLALFLLLIVAGMAEFGRMARKVGARVNLPGCIACGTLLFSTAFLHNLAGERFLAAYLLAFLAAMALPVAELYGKQGTGFQNIAFSFLAILYIAVPFTLLMYLPYCVAGEWTPGIVFLPFLLVWVNDTFAYLAGASLGRHKLFPAVSPNKSWEGFVAGGAATLAAGTWVTPLLARDLPRVDMIVIATIVVLFAVYGDLIESLFKRAARVKDSGSFLPGHGGILDRFDAIFFTVPAIFAYLEWKY